MRCLAIVALLWSACLCTCRGESEAPTEAPAAPLVAALAQRAPARAKSLVLLTVRSLRADVLAAAGGAARTPALDALAARGLSMTRAYSSSMNTTASHATLMTSLYPRDHGAAEPRQELFDGQRTLASALIGTGRRTLAVLASPGAGAGAVHGFERVSVPVGRERPAAEQSRLALAALDELGSDEPFFAWIDYADPSTPYAPPAGAEVRAVSRGETPFSSALRAASAAQRADPWFAGLARRHRTVQAVSDLYVAEVEAVDAAVGALIAGLEARGRLADTLLVVTADHGENLGEHELYFHHAGLYDPVARVPLLVAGPDVPTARDDTLCELADVAPTVLELMGASRWEPMRGRSLLAQRRGESPTHAFVVTEHDQGQLLAVRSRDGTLIVHRRSSREYPSYPFVQGRRELYDSAADPHETTPLNPNGPLGRELEAALRVYLDMGLALDTTLRRRPEHATLQAQGPSR